VMLNFYRRLLVVFAMCLLHPTDRSFAVEVTTVEGNGCPFTFEVTDPGSLAKGTLKPTSGFTVSWQWPGGEVFGRCTNNEDNELKLMNRTWCHIEPVPPHRELCLESRRWAGIETFTTVSGSFMGSHGTVIGYQARDASGWSLQLTARGFPPFKFDSDEFKQTLERMKAVVASVRRTEP
jgi:hypothetical protein